MSEVLYTPGAIDIHTHLRQPGTNTAETIEGGTRAALLGGFVVVADMPNNPGAPVWSRERLDAKISLAQAEAWIPTAFYAGSQPESDNVGELERMAGKAIGLKLYGDPTTGNNQAYEAADFAGIVREWHRVAPDKPVMFHAGEHNLADMIVLVAEELHHPLHVCHVNDPGQVAVIDAWKQEGNPVTCGVCPHHLLKTSHDLRTEGVFAEMKPPLAHQDDAEELMVMLNDGLIDVVETDFAPHSLQAKYQAEESGGHCYGVPGIEHVLPLLFYQARRGNLEFGRLMDAVHARPAEILGLRLTGSAKVGWKMDRTYRIGESDVAASCGWTPYMGMLALGRLDSVVISGQTVVHNGKPIQRYPGVLSERGQGISQ